MATQSRKHRGMRTQKVIAAHLAANGWPFAESTGAGRSGSDITGVPGLAIEVKARANFDPMAWVKQANLNPGLPMVMFRPNGMGEASVDAWPVIMRMTDVVALLRAAGYGDPIARVAQATGQASVPLDALRAAAGLTGMSTNPTKGTK